MPFPPPSIVLAVACGAAVGGVLRLVITQFVAGRIGVGLAFYATLFINVSGSFALGAVFELARSRPGLDAFWRAFLTTGLLGGYTTFSTFSYEALDLFSGAVTVSGLGYVAATVGLGITAAAGGAATVRTLIP